MNSIETKNYLQSLLQSERQLHKSTNKAESQPHNYKVNKEAPAKYNNELKALLQMQLRQEARLAKAKRAFLTGESLPMVTFKDSTNIQLFSDPNNVKTNIASMFYDYMKPYLERDDAEQLYLQLESINPNIVIELVYNWKNLYEKEFKPYYGQYVNKDLLVSKIENMTLDKVKKYEDVKKVEVVNQVPLTQNTNVAPLVPSSTTFINNGGTFDEYNDMIENMAKNKGVADEENLTEAKSLKEQIIREYGQSLDDTEYLYHLDERKIMLYEIGAIFGRYDMDLADYENTTLNQVKQSILQSDNPKYLKEFYEYMSSKYHTGNSGYSDVLPIADIRKWNYTRF